MLRLNLQMIDPLVVLNEVYTRALDLAFSYQQSFLAEFPASLPNILADEERVRQVLLNLVNNAIKFARAGGTITLRAWQQDGSIAIQVQDTGSGMDEEEQRWLFEPYHRLERDIDRLSGLGLGLVLAKRLVELHNGRIWVTSQKGVGSTFTFSLPIDPTKSARDNTGTGESNEDPNR